MSSYCPDSHSSYKSSSAGSNGSKKEVSTHQRYEAASMKPNIDRPLLKQPTFDWSSPDKYAKLRNFGMKVNIV